MWNGRQGFQNTTISYRKKSVFLVVILSLGAIAAALPLLPVAHAAGSTSQLTIDTQTTEGGFIYGIYTVLNQSGTIVTSGLTDATFTLNNAQTSTVKVDVYGN